MGVDYFVCTGCNTILHDHLDIPEDYGRCVCDKALCKYCCDNYRSEFGIPEDDYYQCDGCYECTPKSEPELLDSKLLGYCLKLLNMTYDEILAQFRANEQP